MTLPPAPSNHRWLVQIRPIRTFPGNFELGVKGATGSHVSSTQTRKVLEMLCFLH